MLWIKRNLFLAAGGLLALGLLGVGGYYFWTSYQRNSSVEEELKQAKAELTRLYGLTPFPSAANIAAARAEQQRLQTAIRLTQTSFSSLPYQRVRGPAFKALLDTTINELQKKAAQASVSLPLTNGYAFTFAEQQKRLQFSEGSFPTLPEQLAEINAICAILFDAKINKLVALRRGRVTSDDPPAASDYHELPPNRTLPSGAVVSPYAIEVTSFSFELAKVLEGFYKSPNGLLVKAVEVRPLEEGVAMQSPNAMPPPAVIPGPGPKPPVRPVLPGTPGPATGARVRPPGVSAVPGSAASTSGEGFKTVLDEKMLRILLWIDVLKPPAK